VGRGCELNTQGARRFAILPYGTGGVGRAAGSVLDTRRAVDQSVGIAGRADESAFDCIRLA
jgi:hypothetical protein